MDRAEVGFVAAFVKPRARKIERRTVALLETEDPLIEAAGLREVGRANRLLLCYLSID